MTLLQELRIKHPKAIYTYFPINNLETERTRFLSGEVRNPQFAFEDGYQKQYFEQRILLLHKDLQAAQSAKDQVAAGFIVERIAQTELLVLFYGLQGPNPRPSEVELFRNQMLSLYGQPDEALVLQTLGTLKDRARLRKNPRGAERLNELVGLTNYASHTIGQSLPRPSTQQFKEYQLQLTTLFPAFIAFLQEIPPQSVYTTSQICTYFKHGLATLGITGWRVVRQTKSNRVMVAKQAKEIEVGTAFQPTSRLALQQVLGHELLGHVRTHALYGLQETSLQVEEGFAVLIEQLVSPTFGYKRIARYLAAAFSFGIDGRRRDFRDIHEILWRCFVVLTGCSQKRAKERAFAECARVFRICNPNVPVAVFLKDKVYLEGNVAIWRLLLADPPKTNVGQLTQGDWPSILV